MNINCEVPGLNGLSESDKIQKIEKYLWELNDQLKVILSNLELDNFTVDTQDELKVSTSAKKKSEAEFKETVSSLKQKIINTSESITSDIERIRETMQGSFKAVSEQFGQYDAEFFRATTKDALSTLDEFKQIENINGYYIASQGYVKTGNIGEENGKAVYGIEIGDVQSIDGIKLQFSNHAIKSIQNGKTTWYIDNGEVRIDRLIVNDYIYLGGYRTEVTDGVEYKWEGDDEE